MLRYLIITAVLIVIFSAVAHAVPTTERTISEINGGDFNNPVTRTDGTVFDPATEQAGIRIYCGPDIDNLVLIDDFPSYSADAVATVSLAYVVCTLTAYDIDGLESGFMDPPFTYKAPPGLINKL